MNRAITAPPRSTPGTLTGAGPSRQGKDHDRDGARPAVIKPVTAPARAPGRDDESWRLRDRLERGDDAHKLIEVGRLRDEANTGWRVGRGLRDEGGADDHPGLVLNAPDLLEEHGPVHPRHAEIHDDQVRQDLRVALESLDPIRRLEDGKPPLKQDPVERPPARIVVENLGTANEPELILRSPGLPDRTVGPAVQEIVGPRQGALERLRARVRRWPYTLETTLFGLGLFIYLITRLIGLVDFPIYFFTDEAVQTVQAADLVQQGFRDDAGNLFPTYFANGVYLNLSVSVYAQVIPYILFGYSEFVTRAVSALIALSGVAAVGLIAVLDWKVKPNVSLGFLYVFPVLVLALFARRRSIVVHRDRRVGDGRHHHAG